METAQLQTDRGLRERKKATTRRALQHTALTLVARHGLEHVTVEAISDAVGVSPRTFFNYFSSKEEALLGDPPTLDQRLAAALAAEQPKRSLLDALRTVVAEVVVERASQRDELLLRIEVMKDNPVLMARLLGTYTAAERALGDLIAAYLKVPPDQDLYPAMLAGVAGTVMRILLTGESRDPEELTAAVDQAFDWLEQGVPQRVSGRGSRR